MLAALVVGCVRPAPSPEVVEEVHRPELWVDAFSAAGGDGSATRPLKLVPATLARGVTVHLRSGLYAGPFTFDGVRVEGHGEVVLTGDATGVTVRARDAELVGLSVQGGQVGLEAGPKVSLTRVRLSGQRRVGVVVLGALELDDVTLVGSVEGVDGVQVRGGTLGGARLTLEGGLRRGVQLEGGSARLVDVRGEGVKTLVHAVDADTTLTQVSALAGSGPALFFAGGSATLADVTVRGHEYGLEVARGARVSATKVRVRGTAQACLTAVQATLTLDDVELSSCGITGGLVTLRSGVTVSGLSISATRDVGVLVREGTLSLKGATISGITRSGDALGDALHLRDVKAELDRVRVTDVDGSALFVSVFAEVSVGGLESERARNVAVFVERGAVVTLERLLVRGGGGPAVLVPDQARVTIGALSVAGGDDVPIYAECSAGADVKVGRLESTQRQPASRCVH